MTTNDAAHSACPNEAMIQENIKQVQNTVMEDRKIKVQKIAEKTEVLIGIVFTILQKKCCREKDLALMMKL